MMLIFKTCLFRFLPFFLTFAHIYSIKYLIFLGVRLPMPATIPILQSPVAIHIVHSIWSCFVVCLYNAVFFSLSLLNLRKWIETFAVLRSAAYEDATKYSKHYNVGYYYSILTSSKTVPQGKREKRARARTHNHIQGDIQTLTSIALRNVNKMNTGKMCV